MMRSTNGAGLGFAWAPMAAGFGGGLGKGAVDTVGAGDPGTTA